MKAGDSIIRRGIDEPALVELARRIGAAIAGEGVIFLVGDLGAGKTTFARALLRALGIGARVKSPTYSLIETYRLDRFAVHHLDLYRIAEPGEVEWLGLADLLAEPSLLVVEWPERAGGALPGADLVVRLAHSGSVRDAEFQAITARGAAWLDALASP